MNVLDAEAGASVLGAAQLALAACGLLAGVVVVLQPLHVPLRRTLQPALARTVMRQLVWVEWVQRASHPVLDFIAHLSAASVSIEFYLVSLPCLVWWGQAAMVAKLCCVLVLSSYITFGLKDILASPRPKDAAEALEAAAIEASSKGNRISSLSGSPMQRVPAIRVVNPSGDIEDGVPSAHCALTLPMYLHAITCAVSSGLVPAHWTLPLQAAVLIWVAIVAWSRLYLALHSPVDLAAGVALGFCFLALWQPLEGPFFAWLEADPAAGSWLLLAAFAAMKLYPVPNRFTHCYQFTTCWLGSWTGAMLAAWQFGTMPTTAPVSEAVWVLRGPSAYSLLAAKVAAGLVSVAVAKLATKPLMLAVLPRLFDNVPWQLRRWWQPPIALAPLVQHASSAKIALKEQLSTAATDGDDGGSSSSSSDSEGAVHVGVMVNARRRPVLSKSNSGSMVTVPCSPAGVPWDVDTTARFVSYMAAVHTVFHFNVCWAAAGL